MIYSTIDVLALIGVWRVWRNRRNGLIYYYIYYYIILIYMALGSIESFSIISNIILLYKIKWLRDGKRWRIRSHHYLYC